jgi:hypothetical protein
MRPKLLAISAALAAALGISSATWAAAPPAGPPNVASQRLELFDRAQRSCAVLVLGDPKKGPALAALKKSLRDYCECVAVYAVSQTTDDAMRAILATDPEQTSSFIDRQLTAFGVCSN